MNSKTKALNEENNIFDQKISDENQGVYGDMILYLRGSNLSEYDVELVRRDIGEMVLSAQKREQDIQSVIGGDIKAFCDEVIANLPPKTKMQRFLEYLNTSCLGLSALLAINIVISEDMIFMINNMISRKPINLNISISIGSVISIVFILILANLIVNMMMKNAFGKKIKHKKIVGFLAGSSIMAVLLVISWLGKGTLFTINIFVACLLVIVLYAGHKILDMI